MSARSRAEEYLEELERVYVCIKQREDQLEVLRAKAEGASSFQYDRDRIRNYSGKNMVEERMIEYAAKSEEVSRRCGIRSISMSCTSGMYSSRVGTRLQRKWAIRKGRSTGSRRQP